MDHRGRIQAQGGGIEESAPWAQTDPLPAEDGHELIDAVKAKLSTKEQDLREGAFADAHRFVTNAQAGGGCGPTKKSWPTKPRADHRRVDIEVQRGLAFV